MFNKKKLIKTSSTTKYYKCKNALLRAGINIYVKKKTSKIRTNAIDYRHYTIFVKKKDFKKAEQIVKNATKKEITHGKK